MNIQQLLTHLKNTPVKRPQAINLFFQVLDLLELTKRFKYKIKNNDATDPKQGIEYFCIYINKWVIFDKGQQIDKWVTVFNKNLILSDKKKITIHKDPQLETIIKLVENVTFEREKITIELTTNTLEIYSNLNYLEYDLFVFNLLFMAVFNLYNQNLEKEKFGTNKFFKTYVYQNDEEDSEEEDYEPLEDYPDEKYEKFAESLYKNLK